MLQAFVFSRLGSGYTLRKAKKGTHMDTSPPKPDVKPDPEAILGKIDTSSAFGGPSALGRDVESRLDDLSGTPEGAPEPRNEGPDENLQQILRGEVPKSTGSREG